MSFAAEVKKELTLLEVHPVHAKAELAAFIRMNGSINVSNQDLVLNVQTENAAIARRMYSLLKQLYQIELDLLVRRKMTLKKNNVYVIRIKDQAKEVLSALGILTDSGYLQSVPDRILYDDQAKRSYLRGAFLASGSVNSPETSRYHLEIRSTYEDHNKDVCQMINDFDLNARTLARRNNYITYLKESEKISDFLALIGANNSVLKFEDTRIVRDMRNSVNRLVNCESANLNKTVDAASKQINNIQFIDEVMGLNKLDDKLFEIAVLRLENPDVSLKELGELVPSGSISKSGVNHRMRKINQLAEKLRGNEKKSL